MTERQNWELMGAVYKQEAEALRAELAKEKNKVSEKTEKLQEIIREKVDPFLALVQLCANKQLQEQAEKIRLEYVPLIDWS